MSVRKLFILITWWLAPAAVFAQPYQGINNLMTVDEKKGCAPFIVKINHPSCPPAASCTVIYDYPNATSKTKSFTDGDTIHYVKPGNYTLLIAVGSGVDNDQIDVVVNPNIKPAFEAYSCNGSQVRVKVTDSNYENYIFMYDDGTVLPKDADITKNDDHTFTPPPAPPVNRTVTIRGRNDNAANNCADSTRTVLVTNTLPPATIQQIAVLPNATQVQLDHNATPSVQYRLVIATNATTGFQNYKTIYSPAVNSEIISSMRPDNNYYCFRLDPFNPCTNATTAAVSNVVCTAIFNATAQNKQNQLSWSTATAGTTATDFTIIRNTAPLPNRPLSPLSYTDTDVICNTAYTYQLVTNYPGNVKSISLEKTVTAISTATPTAVENISSVVGSTSVVLDWQQDPAFTAAEYSLVKAVNGQYSPLGTSAQPTYTDDAYDTNVTTCYRVSYADLCGNQSTASADACPIRLTGTVHKDNTISLTWTAYTGWTNGVDHYRVEKYNEQGDLLTTFDNISSLSMNDNSTDLLNQVFHYVITAVPVDGAVTPSVSNTITLIKQVHIFYPTAFTPNKDGTNDTYKVFDQASGRFIDTFEMKIFNRWGELMFITNDLTAEGWDGTYKGISMPEGTYVVNTKITDKAGRSYNTSTGVYLLRKK